MKPNQISLQTWLKRQAIVKAVVDALPPKAKEKPVMFKGYKTYITGTLAILGALGGWATGDLAVPAAIQLAVTALMGMFIRNAM